MAAAKAETKALCKALEQQGFTLEYVRNGHLKVTAPDGRKIQIAATPANDRAVKNAITRLKRLGYVPDKKKFR